VASSSSPFRWGAWKDTGLKLSETTLTETLDGGQTFRWRREPDATWRGQWSSHQVRLRLSDDGLVEYAGPRGSDRTVVTALKAYLRTDTDFSALADTLPWRSDPHIANCIAAFPGLRIPRQPFGETLLCFLCSATKQIVQIKVMVSLLAKNHGAEIESNVHALPTWETLATIPENTLRQCQLGFRARYIAASAQFIAARPGWLDETEQLPYPEAKQRLMELPGVGAKVADCVLLFGAGKLEAFPVDTWILKAMARRYDLHGWKPDQVTHFGRQHFGPLAGLAQQYLFAYERDQAQRS
jgi:N-glycosylase/DNA lyase